MLVFMLVSFVEECISKIVNSEVSPSEMIVVKKLALKFLLLGAELA